jgi:hypothetical protein
MGRYYSGDIDGKFWFALQQSNAADRFGSTGEATHLSYYFHEDQLDYIKNELSEITNNINVTKINEFFDRQKGWSEDTIKAAGITRNDLIEYADYKLGIQIRDMLESNGECCFEAEL